MISILNYKITSVTIQRKSFRDNTVDRAYVFDVTDPGYISSITYGHMVPQYYQNITRCGPKQNRTKQKNAKEKRN